MHIFLFTNLTSGYISKRNLISFFYMQLSSVPSSRWECKLIQPLWKTVWRFLKELKIELPYDAAIPLLGIYPETTIIQKDTCTPIFLAALFTIARTWKQPKCPSTEEWLKKMWYIYTMEYYSAIKRNKTGSFVETWMDLETVIQSEVSQKEKNKYCILTHMCGIQKNGIDDPICKGEIETQTQRTNVWIPRGNVGGWEELGDGTDTYTLLILCIKQIANENIPNSTGNST